MKVICFGFFFCLLLGHPVFAGTLAASESLMILSPGQSKVWKTPRGVAVSVSNGSIVRLSDLGDGVRITGRKPGSASIHAGSTALNVSVIKSDQRGLFERLSRALETRRGLEIKVEAGEIVIGGRLLRWEDWQALSEAAEGTSAHYKFAATIPKDIQERSDRGLKMVLHAAHLPELAMSYQPTAVVSLPAEPADLKSHVERVLSPFGFQIDRNSEALGLEPMVRVKLLVAEFKKSMMRQIGIKWPSTVRAQFLPTFAFPSDPSLSLDLNALEENGLGHVLASPTLLCRSGKEASFLAGGEIPIKILDYKVQDIIWKQYGVRLNITPKADFSGRMSIAIETEVSMIDTANTVEGIPGFLTNRIESHFDLAKSQTIVLSGLIKKEWGQSNSGLPVLANLPVLGALFGSRDYRDNRTELVVFVTPEVVSGDSTL